MAEIKSQELADMFESLIQDGVVKSGDDLITAVMAPLMIVSAKCTSEKDFIDTVNSSVYFLKRKFNTEKDKNSIDLWYHKLVLPIRDIIVKEYFQKAEATV